MVRNYVRKTPKLSEEVIKNAIAAVRAGGASVRSASKQFKIPYETLRSRVTGKCLSSVEARQAFRVFNDEQEKMLRNYLEEAANVSDGLSYQQIPPLAFQFACKLKEDKTIENVPDGWIAKNSNEESAASRDWMHGFMKRHSDLNLRSPVQTAIGRAAAFTKPVASAFFDTYERVREAYKYRAADVWNMAEMGLSTVHKPKFVERGTNVTIALAVSAGGDRIPPFFIYPRAKFQDKFLLRGTADARGVANGSGLQTSDTFLEWLQHFKNFAIRSSSEKTLLIMDNHESHMTIGGLNFCKENNIEVLTLPPHTSHRLQPLDSGVFGPLKTYFNNSCKAWMLNTSGVPITIDLIAELVAEPLLKGASSMNIVAGFRSTGIWPFNRDIFSEDDFMPASATDLPCEDEADQEAGPSNADQEPGSSSLERIFAIEDIRSLPKDPLCRPSNRGCKRRNVALLSDSVMLKSLSAKQVAVAKKKSAAEARKKYAVKEREEKAAAKRQKLIEKQQKLSEEEKQKEAKKNSSKRKRGCPSAKHALEPDFSNISELKVEFCDGDEDTEKVIPD